MSTYRSLVTSCSISAIGNSGARSSGPTGCPVPGCSTGGGGAGRSAAMLYQRVGMSVLVEQDLVLARGGHVALPIRAPSTRSIIVCAAAPCPFGQSSSAVLFPAARRQNTEAPHPTEEAACSQFMARRHPRPGLQRPVRGPPRGCRIRRRCSGCNSRPATGQWRRGCNLGPGRATPPSVRPCSASTAAFPTVAHRRSSLRTPVLRPIRRPCSVAVATPPADARPRIKTRADRRPTPRARRCNVHPQTRRRRRRTPERHPRSGARRPPGP